MSTKKYYKNPNTVFLRLVFVFLFVSAEAAFGQMSSVALDWPQVPGATGYELQFENSRDKERKIFKTKVPKWNGELPPSRYTFRLRSLDDVGAPGPWSGKIPLVVKLPSVEPVYPKKKQAIKGIGTKKKSVVFKWKPLSGVEKYKLAVLDHQGEVVFEKTSTSTEESVPLELARDYKWEIVGISAEGDEGRSFDHKVSFSISGGRLEKPELQTIDLNQSREISWQPSDKATGYEVKIQHKPPGKKKFKTIFKKKKQRAKKIRFLDDWGEGTYRIKLRAMAPRFQPSKVATKKFEFLPVSSSTKIRLKTGISLDLAYVPFVRFLDFNSVESDRVSGSAKQPLLSSWKMGVGYQKESGPNLFGAKLLAHMVRGTLFETGDDEEALLTQDQEPIDTNALDLGLSFWDTYRIGVFGLHGSLDITKRSVFALYAEDINSLGLQKNEVVEPMLTLGFFVNPIPVVGVGGKVGYGVPFALSNNKETEDFSHLSYSLESELWLSSHLYTNFSFQYSMLSFEAPPPNGVDTMRFESSEARVSAMAGYLF